MPTRRACPPLTWCGYLSSSASDKLTAAISSRTRGEFRPHIATMNAERLGKQAPDRQPRRQRRQRVLEDDLRLAAEPHPVARGRRTRGRARRSARCPRSAGRARRAVLAIVVLPDPLSPTSPIVSRSPTVRETSSTARSRPSKTTLSLVDLDERRCSLAAHMDAGGLVPRRRDSEAPGCKLAADRHALGRNARRRCSPAAPHTRSGTSPGIASEPLIRFVARAELAGEQRARVGVLRIARRALPPARSRRPCRHTSRPRRRRARRRGRASAR